MREERKQDMIVMREERKQDKIEIETRYDITTAISVLSLFLPFLTKSSVK